MLLVVTILSYPSESFSIAMMFYCVFYIATYILVIWLRGAYGKELGCSRFINSTWCNNAQNFKL